MRFSKTTEYAIRILAYMAVNNKLAPHSANVIHQELDLPYKYITKLMTMLSKKELIKTSRGREGGFSLNRGVKEIVLIDIVNAVSDMSEDPECIIGFKKCSSENPCCMHNHWVDSKHKIDYMLNNTTLYDLQNSGSNKY